ncbi:MAG: SH3 domain-containing protein [Bacteroidota bacterium]|jgi:uncharacterized protein YgiM (DUF1202 family)
MKNYFLFVLFMTTSYCMLGQLVFEVQADSLNIRKVPSSSASRIGAVRNGEIVDLIDSSNSTWYKIESKDGEVGFVLAKYLTARPDLNWQVVSHQTGERPVCENIFEQFDFSSDYSEYEIKNSMYSTDAVVKIYKVIGGGEVCIRSVFIRHQESFTISNIPLDYYKVRYATGSNFVQQIIDGKCRVKFLHDADYFEIKEILDFKNYTRSLILYETISDKKEELDEDKKEISEDFFNK